MNSCFCRFWGSLTLWGADIPRLFYKKGNIGMEKSLEYIHGLYRKGTKPDLSRVRGLLQALGNPQEKLKFIHIAGTNGKGSTAAMSASILHRAGYRTGLFTSPYIYRFNERIQINGCQIPDADVVALTARIRALAQQQPEQPTEFDFVTAMAMEYFAAQGCDIVVLEVGVGGALDSTNIIPAPEVAVITNIGLDHTDLLGDTVEKIAAVKAGIIKPGCHAVMYRGTPGVEQVYETVCREKQVPLRKADFDGLVRVSHSLEGQTFHCGERKNLELPLLGDHQLHNAAVVLSVMGALKARGWNIPEDRIRAGMREVSWPGRFDIISRDPLFIIDGGHNPQCIEALVKNIRDYLQDRKIVVLTGVLADKDYADMFRPVMPYPHEFVCITPDNPRKMEARDLARYLTGAGAKATARESVLEGVATARELAGSDGVVLCFGSLYSIGAIRGALAQVLGEGAC